MSLTVDDDETADAQKPSIDVWQLARAVVRNEDESDKHTMVVSRNGWTVTSIRETRAYVRVEDVVDNYDTVAVAASDVTSLRTDDELIAALARELELVEGYSRDEDALSLYTDDESEEEEDEVAEALTLSFSPSDEDDDDDDVVDEFVQQTLEAIENGEAEVASHTGSTELEPYKDSICAECGGTLEYERVSASGDYLYYCWSCGNRERLLGDAR